jgi:methylated-DNA-[protein]-cysteine S-methyltransferase
MRAVVFETDWGWCGTRGEGRRIGRLILPVPSSDLVHKALDPTLSEELAGAEELAEIVGQVRDYFAGRLRRFDIEPAFGPLTPWRKVVYRELRKIGYGETITYGGLARRAGKPGGAQAVGQAMQTNPVPLIVPCRRVLAAHGLGGYSGLDGRPRLELKARLLALEAGRLSASSRP